jgi:hypothetical protein
VSFNVAMLKAMQDEGLELDAIIRILSAGEPMSAADKRREWDRNRKREKREAERLSGGKSGGNPPDPSPNERDNLTPTRGITPPPSGGDPKPKKHRLPVDWEPKPFTPGTLAAQTVLRWEPGRIERELSKFRDHHTAAGTKWENWQAAWSKWVNNSGDFERGRNVASIGKSQAAYAMLNIDPDEPF